MIKTDVLIIGGGVSGSMAAIAAARCGADTILVERGGCLGGMWSAGLVGFTIDKGFKNGLINEFLMLVDAEMKKGTATIFETQKYLLEKLCIDAGVKLYFHSQAFEINTEERKISSVKIISKSGVEKIEAKIYIDATGDGDIAYMAGCSFEYGRDGDHKAQPMSMIALVAGLDVKAEEYYYYPDKPFWTGREQLRALMDNIGVPYSLGCPSIRPIGAGLGVFSINQEYGKNGCNVNELTSATVNARAEIYRAVEILRTKCPEMFGALTLVNTPECIGVREGRRIHCKYTITKEDMLTGKEHPDAVCKVRYWVDIHSLENDGGQGFTDEGITVKPYDLPFRALLPIDCDNLIMAGRSIGGDFYAHASYRVIGNMAPVGEAAGKMAAAAVSKNKNVADIPFEGLK